MRRIQSFWILLILICGACAGGCAHFTGFGEFSDEGAAEKKLTIAVIPFSAVSEARGSGLIVSDILANKLYAIGDYNIISPETVVSRLADRDLETLSPQEMGSLAGAPYILTGRVTEYTYKAGVGETPAVGVTARLLPASSGKVLWSATRTGVGGGNWIYEDSLSWLTGEICGDLADSLNNFLKKDFPQDLSSNGEANK